MSKSLSLSDGELEHWWRLAGLCQYQTIWIRRTLALIDEVQRLRIEVWRLGRQGQQAKDVQP